MENRSSERMTVRLPKETLSTMDTMRNVFGFDNRSEFVRIAVEEYIERRRIGILIPQKETERIEINLPPLASAGLEYLVRQGYQRPENVSAIFSMVVSDWIYGELERMEGKKPAEIAAELKKLRGIDEGVREMLRK